MAAFEMNRVDFGTEGFVENIRARFAHWNLQRKTRRELYALADRDLEDIGLCRADVEDVVRAL